MTPDDFPQYAALWREQVDPGELAELRDWARNIERNATRRAWFDNVTGFATIGILCVVLWAYPTSPQLRFGFALILAIMTWLAWRRYEITRTSRTIAVDSPRAFFEAAIRNVAAEVYLSTVSLYLLVPFFVFMSWLVIATRRWGELDALFLQDISIGKRLVLSAITVVLIAIYFVRDNLKLRRQLRRLEDMRREWEEQEARDLGDDR
ncbi:MAG TPA: hypothetical protein VJS15_10185 [Allosphingosinicella sp.]|nr:hypothetical protein [Allosphingosinicella sp.]